MLNFAGTILGKILRKLKLKNKREVFKDKERINPINFYYGNLSAEEYANLLKKASLENQSLD